MDTVRAALEAVNRVYEAALAPEAWEGALAGITDLLRGDHASLFASGPGGAPPLLASARLAEDLFLKSVATYTHLNLAPVVERIYPNGIAYRRSDYWSDRDFSRSVFYNEISAPIDGFYSVHVSGHLAQDPFLVGVCRSHKRADFDEHAVGLLQALLPHLTTALAIRNRLGVFSRRTESLARLLDRIAAGVILTDARTKPLFANQGAAALLAAEDGLAVGGMGLIAATPAATRALGQAIRAAADSGEARPETILARHAADAHGRRVSLARPSGRPPLSLALLPVARLGLDIAGAGQPEVAIFITEPDAPPAIDRSALREAYRLTPRECDVAILLASGYGPAQIAARLGLGEGTVRFHLKRTFEKTGTHGQVALGARLRAFAKPYQ